MNSVNVTMVVLRLIHILSGIFWVGTTFFLVGFLQPVIAQSGPEGGRFAQRLMSQKRFQAAMSVAAGLTILSGLVLYGRVSAGFQRAWVTSGPGLVRRWAAWPRSSRLWPAVPCSGPRPPGSEFSP